MNVHDSILGRHLPKTPSASSPEVIEHCTPLHKTFVRVKYENVRLGSISVSRPALAAAPGLRC